LTAVLRNDIPENVMSKWLNFIYVFTSV